MKVDIQDVSSCRKTLKIEIPVEDVKEEIEKAYEEVRTKAPIRGFRKGKAPRNVLRMRFGEYVKTEVIDKLIPPALQKAVDDAKLEILRPLDPADMNPPIDEMSVKEDEPLVFEVTIDVKPEIIVPDLTQLEVEKGDVNVIKEDVDKYLEDLREERASYIPVEDRAAQEGDYVTIDISATSDDEVLDEQKDQVLEVGENIPVPELSKHLVGVKPGDEKDFSISFPEDYKDERLAGKEVSFHIIVSKITEKQLPLLDDDFAKDLDADDLQKLIATVWNQLVEFRRWQQRADQKKELVKQLLEKSQFEVPESLVEDRANALIRIDRELQRTEESEVSEEDRAKYKEMALEMIKRTWLLDEIAKDEEVEATDEEVEAEVKKMAEERDRDPQKYMRLLEAANRIDSIKDSIRENKIYDFLIEKASPKRGLIV